MTQFENYWGIHTGEGLARKYPQPIGKECDGVGVGPSTEQVVKGWVVIHLLPAL